MKTLRDKESLAQHIKALRSGGKTIAFVPTMGALHAGHLKLVEEARKQAGAVVVSIFVNPTQFGPNEDFSRYPRTEEADITLLAAAGADAAYLPRMEDIYPEAPVVLKAGKNSDILCGAFRPGHFDGVVTVVKRLFDQTAPDIALFGEKDYQQLWLIRQMHYPVKILGVPTMREADGLAMSSRNRYLRAEERAAAPAIFQAMQAMKEGLRKGEKREMIEAEGRRQLEAKGFKVEYCEIRDSDSLELTDSAANARIFVAARLAGTRLIDNLPV